MVDVFVGSNKVTSQSPAIPSNSCMVSLMGCGPSWPASRRLWEVSGHEESTQITEVMDSGRESVVSAAEMVTTFEKPLYSDMRKSQTCAEGFNFNCNRKGLQGGKPSTTDSSTPNSRHTDAYITYNTFSSTKAVYIRSDNQTSTITVRLSTDCSTLQVERLDIPHGAMTDDLETVIESYNNYPACSNEETPGDLIAMAFTDRLKRSLSEPVLTAGDCDKLCLEESNLYSPDKPCLL